jgi:hypothetical protein
MSFDPPAYRRQDLYDQVWTEPIHEVAKRYGISDVALAKICKKLDIRACDPIPQPTNARPSTTRSGPSRSGRWPSGTGSPMRAESKILWVLR